MLLLYCLNGLLFCLYFIYKWWFSNKYAFKEMGIDFIKPRLLFGNTGEFFFKRHSMPEYIQAMYNKFPNKKCFGFFVLRQPIVMICDPELTKQITVKDSEYFEGHNSFFDQNADSLIGNSLIMLKGNKWHEMRTTLTPSFTGSKMRLMFDMIAECTTITTDHLMKQTEKLQTITWEMRDLCMRYTKDVIASCAFGIKVNSLADPNNPFLESGKEILNFTSVQFTIKMAFSRIMPKVSKLFFTNLLTEKLHKFFRSMVLDTMRMRERENIYRPDMIHLLMQVQKEAASKTNKVTAANGSTTPLKRTWTEDEVVAQCFDFYLAGFDLTAGTVSFLTYELAVNPDVQQTLYNEIAEMDKKLNGEPLRYDNMKEMKYLDQVVKENFRHWLGVIIDRICVKDYVVDNVDGKSITIKKGTNIWCPVYAIHHDPKYYADPMKFDPNRFSDENKINIQSGTFLPFGMGPRNCIGSRFALMEIKLFIYKLLLNFSLEPSSKTQIPLKLKNTRLSIVAENGIHLDIKRRKQNYK